MRAAHLDSQDFPPGFNSSITACERGNQSQIALKLFEKMPQIDAWMRG